MLYADEVCTLVRHIASADGDSYFCCRLPGCSWHSSSGNALSRQGEAPEADITVRIPENNALWGSSLFPKAGDYMVRGDVAITSKRQLVGLECFRIAAVTDNRRGSRLRHVKVVSSK